MRIRYLYHPLSVVLVAALLFVGCDNAVPTASESDKPMPAMEFDQVPPAEAPAAKADETAEPFGRLDAGTQVIPGQYIVVLKETGNRATAQSMRANVRSLAVSQGAEVRHEYSTVLNGFAARLPDAALRVLERNPNVAYIEQDQEVHALVTWGLDRVDQRDRPLDNQYNPTGTGSGVHAYIIDTGIRASHNEFSGRVGNGYDSVDGGSPDDCNGHGTHVAGTVGGSTYGVAPGVTLHGVRVLNCSGSGTNSGVIAGVDWVAQNHVKPAVANMSLGGGASSALDNAVNNAIAAGVTFAVAAGNESQNACNVSPARVNSALTVGSTTSSDVRSSFSNYGSCVDLFAPGSSITSAWYTSNSATNTISGTSMASPHVAGGAAIYLQSNPSASPATVFNALTSNASTGKLSSIGSGSPNLLLFVGDDSGGGGGGGGGGGDNPCPSCEVYSGSLSGSGDYDYHPNGTYFYSGSGTHEGYLRGSAGDFDLYLWKWSGGRWRTVAQGTSSNSSEDVTYSGSSGYYVWRVYSYSGSGSYDLYIDRP